MSKDKNLLKQFVNCIKQNNLVEGKKLIDQLIKIRNEERIIKISEKTENFYK
jgi:hypothetical protein